ncbi:hypothetical protein RHGRI_034694 [Rhododendron griersonianum]|uniref:Uncharacterized protein n=1 Tax=Rhododendron griersonianum TaxID=479676 RepID=A0AAV6I4G1_9ERIC|nr:hypothetical protein RHGRI_034694 [Rhododendron griersonianum]
MTTIPTSPAAPPQKTTTTATPLSKFVHLYRTPAKLASDLAGRSALPSNPPEPGLEFCDWFPSDSPVRCSNKNIYEWFYFLWRKCGVVVVLRTPNVLPGSGSTSSRGVHILKRGSDVGDLVVNQPKEKGIAASPQIEQNDDVRSSPKRVSAGNLVQTELGNPLPDANPKPSWSEVVTQDRGASRMKFSYHPPQIKNAKLVVCPPEEVVDAGISKWADCVVGYFLDKKLPY